MNSSIRNWSHAAATFLVLIGCASAAQALADDPPKRETAPPAHAILSDTLNGWIFVPMELKADYDKSLQKLESLQSEVDAGQLSAKEAADALAELKAHLNDLRAKISASRVLVEGAKIHEQTEQLEFELGPEKRLAITANHVHVRGWYGPKVKVELKKRVLSTDEQPVDAQLNEMRIVHVHDLAPFAGQTDAQWDAQEAEFMAGAGANLSEAQLLERKKLVDEIRASRAHYRELLEKNIDQLSVAGLDYQSNKVINMEVKSPAGGNGRSGSVRQRYAELTVFVPPCVSVCVRGARRSLQVENLDSSLTIVDEDSTDSDARGDFRIQGLKGDLLCKNFPLRLIEDVDGDVDIESTTEFGIEGAGLSSHIDMRDMTPARPFSVEMRDIAGAVRLRYGRVLLNMQNIAGAVDVENEFGDTRFKATTALSDVAHRIVTQSGRIDVELSAAAWGSVPVLAVTNHGGVRTNLSRAEFEEFYLTGQDKLNQVRRNWSGFRKPERGDDEIGGFAILKLLDRFTAIVQDSQRSAGLDLLSRSGRIVVVRN